MDQVEIGQLSIAYRRGGEGPPLVLLHGGFGLDIRSWRRQFDALVRTASRETWMSDSESPVR